jgi:hypothetical protein
VPGTEREEKATARRCHCADQDKGDRIEVPMQPDKNQNGPGGRTESWQ